MYSFGDETMKRMGNVSEYR